MSDPSEEDIEAAYAQAFESDDPFFLELMVHVVCDWPWSIRDEDSRPPVDHNL